MIKQTISLESLASWLGFELKQADPETMAEIAAILLKRPVVYRDGAFRLD